MDKTCETSTQLRRLYSPNKTTDRRPHSSNYANMQRSSREDQEAQSRENPMVTHVTSSTRLAKTMDTGHQAPGTEESQQKPPQTNNEEMPHDIHREHIPLTSKNKPKSDARSIPKRSSESPRYEKKASGIPGKSTSRGERHQEIIRAEKLTPTRKTKEPSKASPTYERQIQVRESDDHVQNTRNRRSPSQRGMHDAGPNE